MAIYEQKCIVCNKTFYTRNKAKKCCSVNCMSIHIENKNSEFSQLCWHCANATGKCSWSRDFTPVKGWTATPTIIKNDDHIQSSYAITACPELKKMRIKESCLCR